MINNEHTKSDREYTISRSVRHGLSVLSLAVTSLVAVLTWLGHDLQRTDVISAVSADFPNCRFGVGVVWNTLQTYSYTPTRTGWYVNWSAEANPPVNVDFLPTLRMKQTISGGVYLPSYTITPALEFSPGGLGPIVEANPRRTWLIGNEIDRSYYQDEMLPDMYAQAYHDAYTFIKGIDPTARIAIGAVIQPTPVRLKYLDLVLAAYLTKFNQTMPVDVWNTHIYILQETRLSWGASIPPGIDQITGTLYTIPQSVDIAVFAGLMRDLRAWMKVRGYQNTPVLVTEYGVLFPLDVLESQGVTLEQIKTFLGQVVTYMDTATDINLGYPADNYRLVQQAAIYSLDDDSVDNDGFYRWGSFLYNSTPPYTLTTLGAHYISVQAGLSPQVDLRPYQAWSQPGVLLAQPGESITATVNVAVVNSGNTSFAVPLVARLSDLTGGVMNWSVDQPLAPFTGCGTQRVISLTWPDLDVGAHTLRIEVDPDNLVSETVEGNNVMTFTVVVGPHAIYVPIFNR